MNTATQDQELNPTVGRWTHYWKTNDQGETDCGVVTEHGCSVCRAPRYQTQAQWEANANLICQAHDAYEDTGMTPMQLVARIAELESRAAPAQPTDAELEMRKGLQQILDWRVPDGSLCDGPKEIARALLDKFGGAAQPSGWQPIETAPVDGQTLLLGYHNKLNNWRTTRGQWIDQTYIDKYAEDPDSMTPGWYETPVEDDDGKCWLIDPTHWMPLPPPPPKEQL